MRGARNTVEGLKTKLQSYIARVMQDINSVSDILGDLEKRLERLERKVDQQRRPRLMTDDTRGIE